MLSEAFLLLLAKNVLMMFIATIPVLQSLADFFFFLIKAAKTLLNRLTDINL